MVKVIFVPGNGGGTPKDNWFPYLQTELEKLHLPVVAKDFPDNHLARESFWVPFLKDTLQADENTIIIGYSSGAVAAMRLAETTKILGSVLIGACYTDLGDETERLSGYYNRPWDWQAIRDNQQWIVQFASTDDPYIPVAEARYVHEHLQTEYYEYTDQGHFGSDVHKTEFPEIINLLKKKLTL
jgi:predicted alpha/beta hydrolase family esterase